MSIQLEDDRPSAPPTPKYDTVGQEVVIGIANVDKYHQHGYSSELPKFWDGKTPVELTWEQARQKGIDERIVEGDRVTGIVVSSDGDVTVSADGDQRPIKVGEVITLWMEGGRWKSWNEARSALRKKSGKGVAVGDLFRWKFADTSPATNPKHNDRKDFEGTLRHPEAKDGDIVDRCEKLYYELRDRPSLDSGPTAADEAPTSDYDDDGGAPF